MIEQVKELAGLLVAVVLALDGLLHVYWATGRTWPAPNQLTLIQSLLNSNKLRLLRPRTLGTIACLLFLGALITLARVNPFGISIPFIPDWFLQTGTLVVASGLLIRGLAGIAWAIGLVEAKSKLFYRLNLILYIPICFVLFTAAVIAASS